MATKATTTKKASAKKTVSRAQTVAPASSKFEAVREHVSTSLRSAGLWRALGAEFIGTFLLASTIIVGQGQPIFVLFGLVGVVLAVGAVSGAHVNPAITIAAWVTKRVGWLRALGYIFAQVLGAIGSFYALKGFLSGAATPTAEAVSYGATAQQLFTATPLANIAGKEWFVLFAEILGTAILAYGVGAALRAKDTLTAAFSAGLAIFIALMVGVTAAGYVGGSSIINPAVAVALQAFDTSAWSYAVYALGPVIGATLGMGIFELLRNKKTA